ncbi:DNA-binding response regulator [Pseudonocardiaceae bacterium YIM PH 21723]|nr:DNA-binding response regulator [Pseudonocardiaceae bacterium YIM PH 21723]
MRVLVVDDHPVTRDGVRNGLARARADWQLGEAGDLTTARAAIAADPPDVILVDLLLDGRNDGIELIAEVSTDHPAVRLLIVSQAPMADVLDGIRAGAHGYVGKSATAAQLAVAVAEVLEGPVLPAELAAAIVGDLHRGGGRPGLTPREQEVLHCLAKGYDNREIAEDLGIALRTVSRHLDAIRTKLGTRRRSELIRLARGWPPGHK